MTSNISNTTPNGIPGALSVVGGAGYDAAEPYVPPVISTTGSNPTILTVGAGGEFSSLSAALSASQNGDVIEVKAGTYVNDFGDVTKQVTIVGVGGMVNEVATEAPPNAKGILLVDNNVEIDNFVFTGGTVDAADGGNGAGIRYQGGDMALNNDVFMDNQDGVLAFPVDGLASNTITIDHCAFDNNGAASGPSSGYTHNIYIGAVTRLTVNNSVFEEANVGHELKSRAQATTLTDNVFYDGATGTASYDIDLPNGGDDALTGNVIEKGPDAENNTMVHFGGEGFPYANSSLTVDDNTFIDDTAGESAVGVTNQTYIPVTLSGNTFENMSAGAILSGPGTETGSVDGSGDPLASDSETTMAAEPGSIYFAATDMSAHAITVDQDTPAYIQGGGGPLTIVGESGDEDIVGGAGGVDYTDVGNGGNAIQTAAGSSNILVLWGEDSVNSLGDDTIDLGPGNESVAISGSATINGANGTGSTGADTYVVNAGASAAVAADNGDDFFSVLAAGDLTLTGTETYFQVEEVGATVSAGVTLAGAAVGATVSGGSVEMRTEDSLLAVSTGGGDQGAVIAFGAEQVDVCEAANDTIHAGAGDATVQSSGAASAIYAGTGGLEVFAKGGSAATVFGAAGSTTFGGDTGGMTYVGGSAANALTLDLSSNSVVGGAGALVISGGSREMVWGGSGGIDYTTTGGADDVVTAAGSENVVDISGGVSNIVSNGADTIDAGGWGMAVTVNGAASVTGSADQQSFVLNGADALLAQGTDSVTVGAAAQGAVTVTGASSDVDDLGGALTYVAVEGGSTTTLVLSGAARVDASNTSSVARVSFGAGDGQTVSVTGGQANIALGAGSATVGLAGGAVTAIGGDGPDVYVYTGGGNGADVIDNFRPGTDALDVVGVSVSSETASDGSLTLGMSDGGTILLAGVASLPGLSVAGSAAASVAASGAVSVAGVVIDAGDGARATVQSTGCDTINTGAGADTVYATGPAATVNAGAGSLDFIGGAGVYSVDGGASTGETVFGGAGGGVYRAGAGSGLNKLVAGGGNTTLIGGGAYTAMTGARSGNTVMLATTGLEQMIAGAGAATMVGGTGSTLMVGGTGTDVFQVTWTERAAEDIISGFKSGTDTLDIGGLQVASQSNSAAGSLLTLSDGTRILMSGIQNFQFG